MELTGIQGQIPGVVHLLCWIDAVLWVSMRVFNAINGARTLYVLVSARFWQQARQQESRQHHWLTGCQLTGSVGSIGSRLCPPPTLMTAWSMSSSAQHALNSYFWYFRTATFIRPRPPRSKRFDVDRITLVKQVGCHIHEVHNVQTCLSNTGDNSAVTGTPCIKANNTG